MIERFDALSREFIGVEADSDVYDATVSAVTELLDTDTCLVAVADDEHLRPAASTPSDENWSPSGLPIATTIPGQVFRRGDPCIVDDITDIRRATATHQSAGAGRLDGGKPAVRSLLVIPFGDVGVLIAASQEADAFSEADRNDTLTLVTYANGALERIRASGSSDPVNLDGIASILSHDLKSPLQVAQIQLELAETRGDTDHFTTARSALNRVEELADDLAMLARSDDFVGSQQWVGLDELVETAWTTVPTKSATLDLVDSGMIMADKSTTCQLLENLFSNAVEHRDSPVTVRVGTLENGVFVEDNGPGIPPEKRQNVFIWGVSSAGGHNGLGLAIVDRIAAGHNWDVFLTESATGGARFEITGVEIV